MRFTGKTPAAPLPSQPFGNQIAVHDGVLTTAIAETVVGGTQVVPTETTFSVSRDAGQTFTSSLLTDANGAVVPPPSGPLVPNATALTTTDPIPWISADPTRRNRFAAMLPRDGNLEVYVTDNAGGTWTGPAVIAAPNAAKPWLEFGPTGLLGVMWRDIRPVGGTPVVDAYSAVSFDRGRSFSQPLKVNKTTEPYNQQQSGGDEWSRILLTDAYAYVSWSDSRTGGAIDGIVSRVPLSLYRSCTAGKPSAH